MDPEILKQQIENQPPVLENQYVPRVFQDLGKWILVPVFIGSCPIFRGTLKGPGRCVLFCGWKIAEQTHHETMRQCSLMKEVLIG